MIEGAGLGFRREMLDELDLLKSNKPDFLEVAPENWIPFGGKLEETFTELAQEFPFVCHGLSLSIGSPDPLDIDFVKQVKAFHDKHNIQIYSEHLSYCSGKGHMYDLMPIPFTEQAADYVAERIKVVQDILEQQIAVENVSYYCAPGKQMDEIDFLNTVLEKADCLLLLDVNNIYVNSINHCYDPLKFLQMLPTERIAYGHIAGHYDEAEDLIVDTHGADVIPQVWQILEHAYRHHGVFPTLLERDFNIPPIPELMLEVEQVKKVQNKYTIVGEQAFAQSKEPA